MTADGSAADTELAVDEGSRGLLEDQAFLANFLTQWGIEDAPEVKPDHSGDKARFFQSNNDNIVDNHEARQKARQRQRDRHLADRRRYQKQPKATKIQAEEEDPQQDVDALQESFDTVSALTQAKIGDLEKSEEEAKPVDDEPLAKVQQPAEELQPAEAINSINDIKSAGELKTLLKASGKRPRASIRVGTP